MFLLIALLSTMGVAATRQAPLTTRACSLPCPAGLYLELDSNSLSLQERPTVSVLTASRPASMQTPPSADWIPTPSISSLLFQQGLTVSLFTNPRHASIQNPPRASWPLIQDISSLPLREQVVASIINLAQAHKIQGQNNISTPASAAIYAWLLDHTLKQRLRHQLVSCAKEVRPEDFADIKNSAQVAQQSYDALFSSEWSENLKHDIQRNILSDDQCLEFDANFIENLAQPDTERLVRSLSHLRPLAADSPILQEHLELLINIDWKKACDAFSHHGYSLTDYVTHPEDERCCITVANPGVYNALFASVNTNCNCDVLLAGWLADTSKLSLYEIQISQKSLAQHNPHINLQLPFSSIC